MGVSPAYFANTGVGFELGSNDMTFGIHQMVFTEPAKVVVGFKWITQRIHLTMTTPALLFQNYVKTLSQGAMRFLRKLSSNANR